MLNCLTKRTARRVVTYRCLLFWPLRKGKLVEGGNLREERIESTERRCTMDVGLGDKTLEQKSEGGEQGRNRAPMREWRGVRSSMSSPI